MICSAVLKTRAYALVVLAGGYLLARCLPSTASYRPSVPCTFAHHVLQTSENIRTASSGKERSATRKGWKVAAEFRDPAVSGSDPLIAHRGFADAAALCLKHDIKYIVVESGDRLCLFVFVCV